MQAIVPAQSMHSVQLKNGELIYIASDFAKAVASKTAGFVQLGDEYINVFEIVRMRPVKMTDLEQAIFAYPSEIRVKLMARRTELKEKLGRDFKDASEIHRFAETVNLLQS